MLTQRMFYDVVIARLITQIYDEVGPAKSKDMEIKK